MRFGATRRGFESPPLRHPNVMSPADLAPPGTRLVIEYFDHNEVFALQLPRRATVIRRLSSTGGVDDWYLVVLDEPVEWDGATFGWLLIRSRWRDRPLAGPAETSVFVLLVADPELIGPDPVDVHRFFHVAWGMARAADAQVRG
jgi:hypothetical protein